MMLFSAAIFHWCIAVWRQAFSYSVLRTSLWLVKLSLAVIKGVSTCCSLCSFLVLSFLCLNWIGKGKNWDSTRWRKELMHWEKLAASLRMDLASLLWIELMPYRKTCLGQTEYRRSCLGGSSNKWRKKHLLDFFWTDRNDLIAPMGERKKHT